MKIKGRGIVIITCGDPQIRNIFSNFRYPTQIFSIHKLLGSVGWDYESISNLKKYYLEQVLKSQSMIVHFTRKKLAKMQTKQIMCGIKNYYDYRFNFKHMHPVYIDNMKPIYSRLLNQTNNNEDKTEKKVQLLHNKSL